MVPALLRPRSCWFCLVKDAMHLRLDRRGRPYLSCTSCGVHCFCRSPASVQGLAIVQPYIEALALEVQQPGDKERYAGDVTRFREELARLLAPLAEGTTAPKTSATFADNLQVDIERERAAVR